MAKNSGKPVVRIDYQITGLSVIFGNFGIAELFLIGLKLVLEPTRNLELLALTRQFTKIDGEPHSFGQRARDAAKSYGLDADIINVSSG